MKQKFFTLFLAVLALMVFNSNAAFGQAVGDLVFTGATGGSWHTVGNWSVSNGSGGYSGLAAAVPSASNNVWIPSGITVAVTTAKIYGKDLHVAGTITAGAAATELSQFVGSVSISGSIVNGNKWIFGNSASSGTTFTIDNGASYTVAAGARIYIGGATGSNFTITNNGTFGTPSAVADAGPTITMGGNGAYPGSVNLTFTGSGTTILKAINADNNAPACNITIDQNITLTGATMAVIKLANSSTVSNTTTRSFTINSGKTVTIFNGGWFGNTGPNTGADSNNTFNINGTLDASLSSIYFGCTTVTTAGNQGSTNSQIINIGATGVLKCGTVVKVEKPQAGQTLAVNVATGGEITYKGAAFKSFPTAATYLEAASPYALLTNTNGKATFTNTGATSIALNSNLTADNLNLAAATTLTGSSNTTVNGTLTLGGKLTNNTGNFILGSSATFSGSSANFVDLSSGGSFTRNGVSTSSTLFPIGTGSSYTPLTLTNTTSAPNVTTKVKTTIDNAVADPTMVVNLQWSVVGSTPSTSDIAFQFNGSNGAASFSPSTGCDLGNYTSSWTAINAGTPTGSNPYSVSATGLTIPATTNLYVVGNTDKVVNLGPTSTTWSGSVDTDWTKAGNWSNGVPDNTLDAEIPGSLTNYPIVAVAQTIKSLTVASGASITNNGTLNIVGPAVSVNGTLSGDGAYVLAGTDVQTITGTMSVNTLTLNNGNGVTNSGTLTVNTALNIASGGITGTAPVFGTDMPVSFTGAGTTTAGVALSPSSGNIGTLTLNGSGTLALSNAVEVKILILTAGTLNNSSANVTVTTAVTRTAGALATSPVYSGSIPVTYNGTTPTNSGFELSPSTGSINILTLNGSDEYTLASSFNTTGNVSVASGTFKMAAILSVQDITIASGATLNANISATSGARYTLKMGNGSADNDAVLTVNGTLGNGTKWANDGIDIEVSANAKTFTINGSGGTIGISGMRPANNANSRALDIYINQSMSIDRDNGGSANIEPGLTLQNGNGTFARTLTIPVGVTVTFRGNAGLHGVKNSPNSTDEWTNNYASSSSDQGNCTYNINGTLDLTSYGSGAILNLNTSSGASSGSQALAVNVGSNGTLKMGGLTKMYTAQVGQTVGIVPVAGATIQYGNGTALTTLLTTNGGTLPALPTSYTNLTINTLSGITFPSPINVAGSLTLTAGNINNTVNLDGVASQSINGNGNTISNLHIANTAGVSLPTSLTATTLTIDPNAKLSNNASQTLTSTTFTIQSDATGTGSYIDNGTSTITTPTVQQYTTGAGGLTPNTRFWYVSSPLTGATSTAFDVESVSPVNKLWSFSEAAYGYSQIMTNATELTVGRGYVARLGDIKTVALTGTALNNGDLNITATRTGTTLAKRGYNLLGNPYPSYLNINAAFNSVSTTGLESSIWYRSFNSGTSLMAFDTYNAASGEGISLGSNAPALTNYVPPMQAFWVRATTDDVSGNLALTNAMRSHQVSGNKLRSAKADTICIEKIRLQITNGRGIDQTLIGIYSQARDSFERYDSHKMFNDNDSIPEIYTFAGKDEVAINGLAPFGGRKDMQLGFRTRKPGRFTIKALELSNLEAGTKVLLKDNMLNVSQDLTETHEYTFTSDAAATTDRFTLTIVKAATAMDNIQKTSFDIRSLNGGRMEITLEGSNKANVKVYDMIGKKVFAQDINSQNSTLNKTFSKGVYLVKVSVNGMEFAKKVVINQ